MDREEMTNILGHEPLTFEQMKEMEQMYLQYEWKKVRHQAAIAAMQGILQASDKSVLGHKKEVAEHAVQMADALIKELQKNGKEKET